jgi:hypothetical protein
VEPGVAGGRERAQRARAEDGVLGDQRAVEIRRDERDVVGKAAREVERELEDQPPCVDANTYAATSAICCSLSWFLKEGMTPIPFVTRSTIS